MRRGKRTPARSDKRPDQPARTPTSPDGYCRRTAGAAARRVRRCTGCTPRPRSPPTIARRAWPGHGRRAAFRTARPCAGRPSSWRRTAAAVRPWSAGRTAVPASAHARHRSSPARSMAPPPDVDSRSPRSAVCWRGTARPCASPCAPAMPGTPAATERNAR